MEGSPRRCGWAERSLRSNEGGYDRTAILFCAGSPTKSTRGKTLSDLAPGTGAEADVDSLGAKLIAMVLQNLRELELVGGGLGRRRFPLAKTPRLPATHLLSKTRFAAGC